MANATPVTGSEPKQPKAAPQLPEVAPGVEDPFKDLKDEAVRNKAAQVIEVPAVEGRSSVALRVDH